MKNLIVANWKMNPVSQKEAKDLFNEVKKALLRQRLRTGKGVKFAKAEVVICPPFVYLALRSFSKGGLVLGSQNVFWEQKGAFTGEISAGMLKDLGVEYVIIGHSERRKYFGETDEIINKKIKKAIEVGLKVIFCIGETQEQHDKGEKYKVLENQIKLGLKDIESYKLKAESLNVAYEPVWAIGTGNNCGIEETKESIDFIRQFVEKDTRIIYGGSVNSANSESYIKQAGANGLLPGGASLNPEEFIKIVKSAE